MARLRYPANPGVRPGVLPGVLPGVVIVDIVTNDECDEFIDVHDAAAAAERKRRHEDDDDAIVAASPNDRYEAMV